MKKVYVYSDGACKGNPGPGGYGAIIRYTDESGDVKEKELSAGYLNTTNNRMEVLAAIVALEYLTEPCEVLVVSDSKYLVDAFKKRWIHGWVKNDWKNYKGIPVKNPDLWKRLLKAMEPHKVSFKWIKGHNGFPENERCDRMAVKAAQNPRNEDRV